MCELVRFQRLVSRLTEIVRTMQRFSHIFQQDSKEKSCGMDLVDGWRAECVGPND